MAKGIKSVKTKRKISGKHNARKTFRQAVHVQPDISLLWRKICTTPANANLWFKLAQAYAARQLDWQAGYSGHQALRCNPVLQEQLRALLSQANLVEPQGDYALGLARIPDAQVRIERFTAVLAESPGDWLTCLYLARLHEIDGHVDYAPYFIDRAISLEALPGETMHWIGLWRLRSGDPKGAVAAFSTLLDIRPMRFGSMMFLGEALLHTGQIAGAEKAFSRASLSESPRFLKTLSAKVYSHNYWQEAIELLQKAVSIDPADVEAWISLAQIQSEVYQLSACRESLKRVALIAPDHKQLKMLEAGLIGRMGDARAHFQMLSKEYEQSADPLSRVASSLAMTALYQDDMTADEKAELHKKVCRPIVQAYAVESSGFQHRNTAGTGPVRVGYVSGDLHRQHPVNLLGLPILLNHDRSRFQIYVYHTGVMHDVYTQKAIDNVDKWIEAGAMSDPDLRSRIMEDEIDVLVDLAGHTNTHRLGVFAMRAAPVQATFLGYPHSTGLETIDWIVADPVVIPEEHSHLCSEKVARLSRSVFCWAPVDHYPAAPARPADAPLVFCSFNNLKKLSPTTIVLWSEVLRAVPDALLLLKESSLADKDVCKFLIERFARHGIAEGRLIFRGPSELSLMMAEYGDADIALDPPVYNGGMTSLQALWMGVPVVALLGDNFASRMAASFLTSLGKVEWIADDKAAYVAIAKSLAENRNALRREREALRRQFIASPLGDIVQYTRDLESLYVSMLEKTNQVSA